VANFSFAFPDAPVGSSLATATEPPAALSSPAGVFIDPNIEVAQAVQNSFYNTKVPDTFSLVSAKNEITIGTTLPTSGGVSLIGQDLSCGMDLIFNKLNPTGGIGGSLIKIKTLDSENEVIIAQKNIQTLAEATPIFLGVFGSETLTSVLTSIKTEQLCMIFPIAGDMAFRKPELRYLVNFRASIADEITALLTYSVTKLYRNKVGIFYEDSEWGEEGLRQAEGALKRLGYSSLVSASYPENTVEITAAIGKIADKSPNVILCISHARPTYNFIIQALKKGLKSCKFLGLGEVVPIQEILQKSRGINLITSSVVPSPFKGEIPIVVQYRKDMAQFYANKSMSQFFLEGYCSASIFAECLKQTPPPHTLASLLAKIEGLKNTDFGGLNLDFDPETRTLSSDVWINIGNEKPWPVFKKARK
jgi:ABC-type branched-subunit amino acid transport system substrate-binding protein